ncbi:hypothetical protein Golob_019381 [Gossypium lobatum]|uniref:Uncharacterized protein n=1 Tax=Gossypium lobatum TaxID=34289 RepID=A0A7J8L775_9ROSI|nr:hypothetical protein [Gossypium lobatum]
MSESSSTIPNVTTKDPPCISKIEAHDKEEQQIEAQQTSHKEITRYFEEEEPDQIEARSVDIVTTRPDLSDRVTMNTMISPPKGENISYGSLPGQPVCKADKYGDCIKPVGEDNRPCTVYNRCKRDNH